MSAAEWLRTFVAVYRSGSVSGGAAVRNLSQPAASLGQLNFTLTGQSNITYVIQESPDLINWTPVATNFSPASVLPVSIEPARDLPEICQRSALL